jgi:hypothetical protein
MGVDSAHETSAALSWYHFVAARVRNAKVLQALVLVSGYLTT